MMKTVRAFQTSDGAVHQDELEAIMAEFGIEIRGIIQRDEKSCIREERMPIANLLTVITRNGEEIAAVIRKYENKIRGFNNRGKPKAEPVALTKPSKSVFTLNGKR